MDNGTRTVIDLLAKGLSQTEIAKMFNVTPSAVCQINSKHKDLIDSKRDDTKLAKVTNDTMLDKIERTLLDKIEQLAPMETDLRVLGQMLRTVNGAVRRSSGESAGVGTGATVATAQLHLHANFIQNNIQFKQDSEGQIVQVEGTNLSTASSNKVMEMAGLTIKDTEDSLAPVTSKERLHDLFGAD